MLEVIIVLILIFVILSCFIVQQDEAVVLKKLGTFAEVCKSGVYFRPGLLYMPQHVNWKFNYAVFPGTLSELKGYVIPLRELRYDPAELACTTQDNIYLDVDLVVKFLITDPKDACFKTINLFGDIEDAVLTNLYAIVAALPIALLSPETVTAQLEKSSINKMLAPLGARVVTARVQGIKVPESIRQSTILETAQRRKREAELASLSQENAIRVQMAQNELAKQRVEQERERESQEHQIRMKEMQNKSLAELQLAQAKADAESKRISSEQELTLLKDKHKEELEYSRAIAESDSEKMKREAVMLAEFPNLIEFFRSKHDATAWAQVAASSNSKLIFAPTGALERAAALPVFRELSHIEAPSPRSTPV